MRILAAKKKQEEEQPSRDEEEEEEDEDEEDEEEEELEVVGGQWFRFYISSHVLYAGPFELSVYTALCNYHPDQVEVMDWSDLIELQSHLVTSKMFDFDWQPEEETYEQNRVGQLELTMESQPDYEEEELTINITRQPGQGLGISIAGGKGSTPFKGNDEVRACTIDCTRVMVYLPFDITTTDMYN